MSSPATNGHGIGDALKEVTDHAAKLARLELELARVEMASKAKRMTRGAMLGLLAAVFGLFALWFGLAAAAWGIGEAVGTWAGLLIVCGATALLAAMVGALAVSALRRATPPVPEQTIEEAKRTLRTLQEAGERS